MSVLVTGVNGFIGEVTANYFEQQGLDVIRSARQEGPGITPVDLTDYRAVMRNLRLRDISGIVHCAGVVAGDTDSNVVMAENMIRIAEEIDGGQRVILLGSSSEYGPVEFTETAVPEEFPTNPVTAYGQSKLATTNIAKFHDRVYVARLFNVYGPNMSPRTLIGSLFQQISQIRSMRKLDQPVQVGELASKRDFVHVEDVSRALLTLLLAEDFGETVINVGSGRATSTQEVVEMMIASAGLDLIPPIYETASAPEHVPAPADISRISSLGWQPTRNLQNTFDEMFARAQ